MLAEAESKEKVKAVLKVCAADLEAAAPLPVERWQALFKGMDWKTTTLGSFGVHLKVLLCKVSSR